MDIYIFSLSRALSGVPAEGLSGLRRFPEDLAAGTSQKKQRDIAGGWISNPNDMAEGQYKSRVLIEYERCVGGINKYQKRIHGCRFTSLYVRSARFPEKTGR